MKNMKHLRIIHIDIGGCEGCAVSIFRGLKEITKLGEFISKYTVEETFNIDDADIIFVTGSICINDEHSVQILKEAREKAKILVAFGSCATFGGITRFSRGGQLPKPEHRVFLPIQSIVKVDYAIPGCPPPPTTAISFLRFLVMNRKQQLLLFEAIANLKKPLSGFDLLDDVVLMGLCIGCGACTLSCPTSALILIERKPELIVEKCIRCGTCYVRCPRASSLLVRRYLEKVKSHA